MMNKQTSYIFQSLKKKDLKALTQIHLKSLPDDILSQFPEYILERTVFENLMSKDNIFFGAFSSDMKLVAYIIFSKENDILKNVLLKEFTAFIQMLLKGIFFRPRQFWFYFGIFKTVLTKFDDDGFELCYIGVGPDSQGAGLGTLLLKNVYDSFPILNTDRTWVKTLESTPQNVEFYKKNNFQIFKQQHGRVYLERLIQNG